MDRPVTRSPALDGPTDCDRGVAAGGWPPRRRSRARQLWGLNLPGPLVEFAESGRAKLQCAFRGAWSGDGGVKWG